jgi:GTP:adenosylcobinamide-phosphate guanylyltransferase
VNSWRVIILAAGRGPDDPMAKAFGVAHKCTLPLNGKPMLEWVLAALRKTQLQKPFVVVIDDAKVLSQTHDVKILAAKDSAPASAIAAIEHIGSYPILVTTGDHPLLTPEMISFVLQHSEANGADVSVGLATAETITAEYPETKRTYFNLGGTRVSGCNLFAITSPNGLKMFERWQHLERNRKKPWKLVAAFGILPIVWFAFGMLTPERAFGYMSKRLGLKVAPVFLPFAEAAIDVDKPSDHALAERILRQRQLPA